MAIYYVPPMYYVYILQSEKNQSLYIGYTTDLKKRLSSHNSGENKATRPFKPYNLIHYEAFKDRIDAKKREVFLKSGWGLRGLKKMLSRFFERNEAK